jgi:murein DD-endopeptidase MepM/ murein hydrolase activator NlpD
MPARTALRGLLPLAVLAGALAVPTSSAGASARTEGAAAAKPNGGAVPTAPRKPTRRRPSRNAGRPVLSLFTARGSRLYAYGTPVTVTFRITDRSRAVRTRLDVVTPGGRRTLRRIDLGARRTGVTQSYRFSGREGGALPQGAFELRLSARDPAGSTLVRSARASGVHRLSFYWHHFPVRGNFGFGGSGSRFGAGRPGHIHQGQDIPAPLGTPVVAPRGGRIRSVAYQAAGAGHYVVLDGAGENRDYVFMHLQTGSIRVRRGELVRTGEQLGRVGATGAAEGPHLHFEVWEGGPWQAGGHPIDPLPYLHNWDGWS